MTTIVYRDGVMAADSRCGRAGWMLPGRFLKVSRRDDGTLIGVCGGAAESARLAAWLMAGQAGDQPGGDETTALVVSADRRITVYECGSRYEIDNAPFFALGSGFPAALGALHMGASAVEAVTIAALVDPNVGGDVVALMHDGRTP